MASANEFEKNNSKLGNLIKSAGKKAAQKIEKKAIKALIKIGMKIGSWIGSLFGQLFMYLLPVLMYILIPLIIVSMVVSWWNSIEVYYQENPELVRIFLQNNYEQFENEVRKLLDEEDFTNYMVGAQFDNAYAKMIFGGTECYTQDELQGNYIGSQGITSDFVTKSTGEDSLVDLYEMTPVLSDIMKYIDAGVSVDNIYINDAYLQGHSFLGIDTSIKNKKSAQTFNEWVVDSFYCAPMYYCYSLKYNPPSAIPIDPGIRWHDYTSKKLREYDDYKNDGDYAYFTKDNEGNDLDESYSRSLFYSYDMLMTYHTDTYKEVLDFELNGENHITNKQYKEGYYGVTERMGKDFISNAILGEKQVVKDSALVSLKKWVQNRQVQNSDKDTMIATFYLGIGERAEENKENDTLTALDKWLEEYNGFDYIFPLNSDQVDKYSQRQYSTNKLISQMKDNFAEYFCKEIYYTYPSRDFVVDYFLGTGEKAPSKDKKIAFLQRSFYAMATGNSLDIDIEESYTIEGDTVYNDFTGSEVGKTRFSDCKIEITDVKITNVIWNAMVKKADLELYEMKKNDPDSSSYMPVAEEYNHLSKEGEYITWSEFNDDIKYIKKTYETEYWVDVYDKSKGVIDYTVPKEVYYEAKLKIIDSEGNSTSTTIEFITEGLGIDVGDSNEEKKGYGKITIKTNDANRKILEDFINEKSFTWKDSYYENNCKTEDGKKALDSIDLSITTEECAFTGFNYFDINSFKPSNIASFFNAKAFPKEGETYHTGYLSSFVSGTGSSEYARVIPFSYNDASCFNWTKNEITDNEGNVTEVIYDISIHFADVSIYDDEEGKYRVALAFETEGAVANAFALLEYVQTNQSLEGVSDAVDFEQLFIPIDADDSGIYTTDADSLTTFIIDLIMYNETSSTAGNRAYGSIRNPIANTSEVTLTAGFMQWYGNRARNLIQKICNTDKSQAKEILGKALYKKITKNICWISNELKCTEDELSKLEKLLTTDIGKSVQDELAITDIEKDIKAIQKDYGYSDYKLIAYAVDCKHQSPAGIGRVTGRILEEYGNIAKLEELGSNKALKILRDYAKKDVYTGEDGKKYGLGVYVSRRDKSYNYIIKHLKTDALLGYGFPLPANSGWTITSGFGYRTLEGETESKLHAGIDIAAPEGTAIYAAKSGTVVYAGWGETGTGYGGYGYCVGIKDTDGNVEVYGHMKNKPCVSVGDEVKIGKKIGKVGSTGYSTGNHLHFEVRKNGQHGNYGDYIDPLENITFPTTTTDQQYGDYKPKGANKSGVAILDV